MSTVFPEIPKYHQEKHPQVGLGEKGDRKRGTDLFFHFSVGWGERRGQKK
jgi:hypothetical protein